MTLALLSLLFIAQPDTLTLDRAYRAAAEHYPRAREAGIALAIRDLRVRNLESNFLPSLSLGGQAVYHTDVASIPMTIPGVDLPSVSHDQYRVGLTVHQLVYDGGTTSARRAIEHAAADVAGQEVAVEVYAVREQVEAAWFGSLLGEAEAAILDALAEDVAARLDLARSYVERGVATGSNAEILEAEQIRVGQQREAALSRSRAARDVLEHLTGWTLGDSARLELPAPGPSVPLSGRRPEIALFELSRRSLDRQADLASRRTRPRVTSFADAAVGRPQGQNMFETDFGPWFSVGVRIGWPVWDWNGSRREREALRLQSDAVTAREEAFEQRVRTAAAQVRREIERLEAHLEGDAAIVGLRARVSAEARSRFENGVITATDYLVERNEEHRARLAESVHRIQLAQARARLATILGAS